LLAHWVAGSGRATLAATPLLQKNSAPANNFHKMFSTAPRPAKGPDVERGRPSDQPASKRFKAVLPCCRQYDLVLAIGESDCIHREFC
jgi:hypothetical protein